MRNPAPADHPILDVIVQRWSPRAFDPDRVLSEADLAPLFEAARWAPSNGNSQPWRFVYALRGEAAFDALLACADEGNQRWAFRASALVYAVAREQSDRGRELWHRRHDTGMALGYLLLQATAAGYAVHPFGGFDSQKVIDAAGVPDGFEPCTGIAIGFPGDVALLNERDAPREVAPRIRMPISDFAFHGHWPEA